MYDDHEHDLDQPPEGSIVTPIFLGCGAMGLGCLFSGGLIAVVLFIFAPGLIDALRNLDNSLVGESYELVQAHPEVVAAVGEPMEHELIDLDATSDAENVTLGDTIELITTYSVTGPLGTANVAVVSLQEVDLGGAQQLRSVIVTLEDGRAIRVFPANGDIPPPPQQLAPPDDAPSGGVINIPLGGGSDDTDEETAEDVLDDAALEPADLPDTPDVPEKAPSP